MPRIINWYYLVSMADTQLDRLRARIDEADKELLRSLSERLKYVEQIGEYKRENELEVRDEKRRSEVLTSRISSGKNLGIAADLVRKIFEAILDHSEDIEKK